MCGPKVEKPLELGEGLCGAGGDGGGEEVAQEGFDFIGEGGRGLEVGAVVQEVVDQVENVQPLSARAGGGGGGERGREGDQVLPEQHDAGAARGDVLENPALAVL